MDSKQKVEQAVASAVKFEMVDTYADLSVDLLWRFFPSLTKAEVKDVRRRCRVRVKEQA